ncbi:aryl-alcohol dehydrogenase [Phaeobacter inhibens]|uniref:NAD(P)-dependent alcohol dehydrogenase n=1 Tax=Phaeobacter inhibens TaxID=221822 RepID=UPI002749C5D1|nr:NAD(P)-dependent alcohol dehydrogenase [Phaeobacter inhibens]GLO70903.1 aryl-alcohol dehydrogenase [Phaeobacter inhibens]
MDIQAAIARATHSPLSIETITLGDPRPDEIVVRVVATGICHTDIAMRDQVFPVPQPVVLGHEGAGIVERVGQGVTKVAPGDHVVMTFNSCGSCPSCAENAEFYCHESRPLNFGAARLDGTSPISGDGEHIHGNFFGQSSFASHAMCNERNVVKVSKDANLEMLGPLACGIQTGAGAVINTLQVGVGDSMAVFGCGAVGLSAVMAAKLVGAATVIAVDTNPARLELAKDLGATHAVNAAEGNVTEQVIEISGGGVRHAFEATGIADVVPQALASLGMRGKLGMVGSFPPGVTAPIDLLFMLVGGRSIHGIVEGESNPDILIPHLIEMNRQGRFPFDRMIKYYDFSDINQALDDAESGKVLKPVLRMSAVS